MPQPISNIGKHVTYELGSAGDLPTSTHPAHCQHAISVIAQWSILENQIASVFVNLLGADTQASAAVFSSIRSQAWQTLAVNAAAKNVFCDDEEMRDLISATLEVCGDAGECRNRLAHWIWGHSSELPDAILLADPVAIAGHEARQLNADGVLITSSLPDFDSEIDRRRIFAYTLSDLEAAAHQIHKCITHIVRLKMVIALMTNRKLVRPLDPAVADLLALARDRLSDEPDIHREVERIHRVRERQNAPPAGPKK